MDNSMLRQETPQCHIYTKFVQHLTQCEFICLRIINSFTFGIKLTSTIRYNMMIIIRISRLAITIHLFIFHFIRLWKCLFSTFLFFFSSYIFLIFSFPYRSELWIWNGKKNTNWKVISSHHTITHKHIRIERKIRNKNKSTIILIIDVAIEEIENKTRKKCFYIYMSVLFK